MSGSFPPDKIRNVALVGHGGAGKTSVAEALLFEAGAIGRIGRVEDGSTTCDTEPEEHRRGITIATALASFEHRGHKINLLDCPGYADFFHEVEAALAVADLAVVVVSAVEGVEVQTEAAWQAAARLGVPRMVFVNKIDRDRASWERTLADLRDRFGEGIEPLELPIGEEAAFHGVADLLTDTAVVYDSGHAEPAAIPAELADAEHRAHDTLVEDIVSADDELMEHYLDGDEPSPDQLERTLAQAVVAGRAFPVIVGSATRDLGIDQLARFLCEIGPSPVERPPAAVEAGDDVVTVAPDPAGQPLAWAWKTLADPYVGRITLLKVLSGTLRPDDHLVNSRTHTDEKLHHPFALRGREQLPVTEAPAGDLVAVAKLASTATGDTLAPKGTPVVVPPLPRPAPVLHVAIRPHAKGDEDKLMTALHRLEEEDPAISVSRDDETHQTVLGGTGETHLAVVLERLHRKFGVDVDTEDVRVPYRETITSPAKAEGRYKKQTGGHGQFGVASITIEPLERGAGFRFVDHIVGGAIPRQYIPAVERGVAEAMAQGGAFGFPVVDVQVTLVDGKYHPVDSSEMSFKMAGSLAFREALAQAQPVVLEPLSQLDVTVPTAAQGDVLGDLNARRGRVVDTVPAGDGEQTVRALVPTSELARYAVDLRSLTGGRGRFAVAPAGYEPLPQHLWERVRASTNASA